MRSEEESSFLNKIKKNRFEERWNIYPKDIPTLENILLEYELEKYDNPWVTTIYFGGLKDTGNGEYSIISTSVANLSIRARNFTNKSQINMDAEDEYRFEVKITPKVLLHKRKKYITYAKLTDIKSALYTGNYIQLANENKSYLRVLPKIIRDLDCDCFVPIGLIQYLRNHYTYFDKQNISKSIRITYDTNISLWGFDNIYERGSVYKIYSVEQNVLEIKSAGSKRQYPESLQNVVVNLERAKSKRDVLFDKLQTYSKIVVYIK